MTNHRRHEIKSPRKMAIADKSAGSGFAREAPDRVPGRKPGMRPINQG